MKVKREQRLNSQLQREVYDILKNKVKDHNITEMFSVLAVEVTNDLKHAKVFVSIYSTNPQKSQTTFDAIVASAKYIRSELAKILTIRTVPELHFVKDTSADYGQKIENILSTFTYNTEPDEIEETEEDEYDND